MDRNTALGKIFISHVFLRIDVEKLMLITVLNFICKLIAHCFSFM